MTEKYPLQRNLKDEITLTETGFLFDHVTGLTYSVNPTGGFILQRIVDGQSAAEIIENLVREFDVSESAALKDIEAFYEQVHSLGIL